MIFDMDGTITRPWFKFKDIRSVIGLPEPILENMMAMTDGLERRRAFEILEQFERDGVEESQLNPGAVEVLRFLEQRSIPTGLVTRNSRVSVEGILAKHDLRFDVVLTREDAPVKPSPDPILKICARLGIPTSETLMVGDFKYDIMSGQRAGTCTCLLTNGSQPNFEIESDHTIEGLLELKDLITQ